MALSALQKYGLNFPELRPPPSTNAPKHCRAKKELRMDFQTLT